MVRVRDQEEQLQQIEREKGQSEAVTGSAHPDRRNRDWDDDDELRHSSSKKQPPSRSRCWNTIRGMRYNAWFGAISSRPVSCYLPISCYGNWIPGRMGIYRHPGDGTRKAGGGGKERESGGGGGGEGNAKTRLNRTTMTSYHYVH